MGKLLNSLSLLFCLLAITACDGWFNTADRGQIIAEVGNQKLYLEDVSGLVSDNLSEVDSLQQLSDYVARWVRSASFAEKASQELEDDQEIDHLVEQYRASLMRDRYETQLVEQGIDTVITEQQLEEIYKTSKAGLPAPYKLVNATLIKFRSNGLDLSEFRGHWGNYNSQADWEYCVSFAKDHAALALLDQEKWYPIGDLTAILPNLSQNSIQAGQSVTKNDEYVYYTHISQIIDKGQTSPLSYVRERLKKILLEQRKAAFIGNFKEEIYQDARKNNSVKIYIGNDQ